METLMSVLFWIGLGSWFTGMLLSRDIWHIKLMRKYLKLSDEKIFDIIAPTCVILGLIGIICVAFAIFIFCGIIANYK
jgi:hypothetical protein